MDLAVELGHECVALTDHETISGYIKAEKYYKKIKEKHPDFKLIRGNEIYLTRNGLTAKNYDKTKDRYFHFILLAKDLEGYKQICQLSTRAWQRSYMSRRQRRRPTYYQDLKDIVKPNQGHLIASSACLGSQLDKFLLRYMDTGDSEYYDTAMRWCQYIVDIFGEGNFYLEMQPSNNKEQIFVNKCLMDIADELNLDVIITTDSHYGRPEDAAIHEAFLNSQDGDREVKSFYATTYMMTDEEVRSFFPYLSDAQIEDCYRTIREIKDKCEDFSILKPLKIPSLPWREFPNIDHTGFNSDIWIKRMPALKNFIESPHYSDRYLVDALIDGIHRHKDLQNEEAYKALNECLEMTWESSQVNNAQWSAYFLNLQKIIDECWNAGTIVLPARGSGGGFVLLYALDIIQINCLREKTQMYPWRFLNPARVSVLDIDVDIEGIRRAQTLEHLRKTYGSNRVSNVATFKTEKARSAIQTACRGLGIDIDEANYIANLINVNRGQVDTLSAMYYGDEETETPANQTFINEVNKHKGLWEVASKIEGLICGIGIHAGGVVFTDEDFTESSALMRAPDGTIITQFELHDLEDVSMIKMDLLSVEAADKIHTCLDLLADQGYIKKYPTLRETYENTLGVYKINRDDEKMWDMVQNHEIVDLFQMKEQSGIRGITLTHPRTVDELAVLNSVIRLMATEKGAESPLDKYARFRRDPNQWEKEMCEYGLTKEEREILHKELDISNGLSITQEQFMKLVQLPECGGWNLQFADKLRKSIAKKNPGEYEKLTEQFFANVKEKGLNDKFCNYVWNIEIALSRGYGFNASHTYAYSIIALQEMNLARFYPIIFWNTANLIVDSGGIQTEEVEDEDEGLDVEPEAEEDDEDEEEWEEENEVTEGEKEDQKKEKTKTVDYGKVATAIGRFNNYGIKVAPPNINDSSYTFTPVVERNEILYGLRGITRLSTSIIREIMEMRPFDSLEDFLERIKVNKIQMTNLIKCGAFDEMMKMPREKIMEKYIDMVADKKQRLTLQNMQMLINYNLIPEEMNFGKKVFLFNKFLKQQKKVEYYQLNDAAINFIADNFSVDILRNGTELSAAKWDLIYQRAMDPMRMYLKAHKDEMLKALNDALYKEVFDKYALGSISHWEMESVSFYSHEHELAAAQPYYDDFFKLPEEPEVDYSFIGKDGNEVRVYRLRKIIGTVIDKSKMKNTVTLLTPTGVVNVKVYKSQYAGFDKQLSERGADGKKHVKEKSWFSRGSLLMVQGIRRGQDFIPKKRKDSFYPVISKIVKIYDNGETLEFQTERTVVEE